MKILMIVHFTDAPDEKGNNRFRYLAELLSLKHDVTVLSTSFSHTGKCQRTIQHNRTAYHFEMCYEPGYKKNISLRRFYSHYVFAENVRKYLDKCEKPDVVYCAVPSLDVANVAGDYARRNAIRFIEDIQDLWPEAFQMVFNPPIIGKLIYFPIHKKADRIYKIADEIIGVSETYVERALSVNNKANGRCIPLGTDLRAFDMMAKSVEPQKQDTELWIAYAGTLGHSYNIAIILDALNLIKLGNKKKVVFHVFGDGPLLGQFKEQARNNTCEVVFHGRLPYKEMVAHLQKSDIAVNPISKGAAQSIINKHSDYAAAGLPVISTQECREYQELLTRYKCGINCGVDSVNDVANALQKLIDCEELREQMGRNSRRMAEELFDRSVTYSQIVEIIEGKR